MKVLLLLAITSWLSTVVSESFDGGLTSNSTPNQEDHVVSIYSSSGKELVRARLERDSAGNGGWNVLSVKARSSSLHDGNPDEDHRLQFHRAAGIAESLLTCEIIWQFYLNSYYGSFGNSGKPSQALQDFMLQNLVWMRSQSVSNLDDEYWIGVRQTLAQFDGLVEGYEKSSCFASHPLGEFEFLLLNAYGDLFDLLNKFGQSKSSPRHQFKMSSVASQRCSSLVKPLADLQDVFFGHTTWDTYATTFPRIYKTVRLPVLQGGEWILHQTSFSSSPGLIASLDDWYILSRTSDLVVMETSLNVFNMSLYERVVVESVPCWIRVTVANKLAHDGKSWTDLFSLYHSGTYNNEWLIVDQAKFKRGIAHPGFFFLLDELPGLVVSKDLTSRLMQQKYWASYNIPYFLEVFELAGYAGLAKKSELYSYSRAPRANIFRARHHLVEDLLSMERMMEYNDWQQDPLSLGSSILSIAARGDLDRSGVQFFGGIDSKVSSIKHWSSRQGVFAKVGPTHEQQIVFCWTDHRNATTAHSGHPSCFGYVFSHILSTDRVE